MVEGKPTSNEEDSGNRRLTRTKAKVEAKENRRLTRAKKAKVLSRILFYKMMMKVASREGIVLERVYF